ncbi:MAG: hypothetical protein A2138_12905 [Deltaproteobacteria bacterium RBG_16_71_12]|nr:MAG: hypothetical protein A2138_12905 [Deltaproteobacteria bacterium RBG_16_71_12]
MDLTDCGRCPDCRGYTLRSLEGSTIVCSLPADEAPRGAAAGSVGAAMQRDVLCVAADLPIGAALDLLAEGRQRGVPVIDGADRPVGVLQAADVVAVMRARGFAVPAGMDAGATQRALDPSWIPEQVRRLPVCEVMTRGVPTARESDAVDDTRARMATVRGQRLMVVDAEGRTIGAAQL